MMLLDMVESFNRFMKNLFGNAQIGNPRRCPVCGTMMKAVKGKRRVYKCPECEYELIIVHWLYEDDGGGIAPGFK